MNNLKRCIEFSVLIMFIIWTDFDYKESFLVNNGKIIFEIKFISSNRTSLLGLPHKRPQDSNL